MFEDKTEITPSVKNMLISKLISWENKSIKNENEGFTYFYDETEYLLRMLWQGRIDKMNQDNRDLNIWISKNYLPKEYEFNSSNIKESQMLNVAISHEEIAVMVLKSVWEDYLGSHIENVPKPPKEKVGFFKKLFR